MDKRILFTRRDGGLSVVVPAPKSKRIEETIAAFLERLRSQLPSDAADVTVCESADIPIDRTFREAWRLDAGRVSVDMRVASEIHMGRIREVRNRELQKLDIDYQRADERGDTAAKQSIASRKQALRDIPRKFDLACARTPEELLALWPELLPRALNHPSV